MPGAAGGTVAAGGVGSAVGGAAVGVATGVAAGEGPAQAVSSNARMKRRAMWFMAYSVADVEVMGGGAGKPGFPASRQPALVP